GTPVARADATSRPSPTTLRHRATRSTALICRSDPAVCRVTKVPVGDRGEAEGLRHLGLGRVAEELVEVGSGDSEGAADLDARDSGLTAGGAPLAGGGVGGVAADPQEGGGFLD